MTLQEDSVENNDQLESNLVVIDEADFRSFGLDKSILEEIESQGFTTPTEVQKLSIPEVLKDRDLISQAQTGSGKTAAFALPIIQKCIWNKSYQALVLVPTRELAKQAKDAFKSLSPRNISVVSIVGGEPYPRQIENVNRGAKVIVATPGRLIDHLKSGNFKRYKPETIVLDEADEMMDMGFLEDIKEIFELTSTRKQTLLFSATMPRQIVRLSRDYLKDPLEIKCANFGKQHQDIEQILYLLRHREKETALLRSIDMECPESAIVFCRTKRNTSELTDYLTRKGLDVVCLHGDLTQRERTRSIGQLKDGVASIMIATDVASRGIDISDLSHVYNFDVAENGDRYTHRIGRTGRAGKKGKAISFATLAEYRSTPYFKGTRETDPKLTFREFPSLKEIQKFKQKNFIKKISEYPVDKSLMAGMEEMLEGMDTQELLYKALSYMQRQHKIEGPDRIGFSEKDYKESQRHRNSPYNQRRSSGGRDRGGRGGNRGYMRRKSGGGGSSYRGGRDRGGEGGGERRGGYRGGEGGGSSRRSSGGESRGGSRSGGRRYGKDSSRSRQPSRRS